MSETLGSNGIEDVLSSVRRLVSTEVRPRTLSRDLGMERLLLTPALQVTSDPPIPAPLILTQRSLEPAQVLRLETPVGDVPEALGVAAVDVVSSTAPEPLVLDAEIGQFDDLLMAEPVMPASAQDGLIAEMSPLPEAELQIVDGQWEDAIWSEAEPQLSEVALGVEEAEVVLPEPEAVLQSVDAPGAETLTAAQAEFNDSENLTGGRGNSLATLDEAALQDVLRALIREELQGALGERITQSVRKLVRAEVNRALTARSLD